MQEKLPHCELFEDQDRAFSFISDGPRGLLLCPAGDTEAVNQSSIIEFTDLIFK